MGQLDGRVAVVTGGNGGIGLGLAEALLDAGATVDVWARNEAKSAAALELLARPDRPRATARRCDVADEADVECALAGAVEEHGRVDVMVANAGLAHFVPFLDTSLDDWHRVTATDLDGVFLCFREAGRHMKARHANDEEGGALVAVSSISAMHGTPRHAAYAASKAGILGLVRSAAVELARYGIRANALLPGWTEIDTHPETRDDERLVEMTTKRTPVRRWGTPADLREAIVFLADPATTFHTGDTIVVDGGYTVQ
ncbi:MAG: SDR family oxidoreductase [Acidimicrobiia bacterium]